MVVTVCRPSSASQWPPIVRKRWQGRPGAFPQDNDFVEDLFVTSTHGPTSCSSPTKIYRVKVHRLPIGRVTPRFRTRQHAAPREGSILSPPKFPAIEVPDVRDRKRHG